MLAITSMSSLQSQGSICVVSITVERPENKPQVEIPPKHYALTDDFNKTKASELLPHCSYDCAIDPLVGTMPPHNCIYHLSTMESQAMDEYFEESLKQRVHAYLNLTSICSLLICVKEGGQPVALHRLLTTKPSYHQVSLSSATGALCIQATP